MHDVIVHRRSLHILHVDTIVREAIAFIAPDQRAAGVAVDLDAVVPITIADFVVQELGTVSMTIVVFGKHELVVVARVAISRIVDIAVLNNNARGTAGHADKGNTVSARVPAFKTVKREIGHPGTAAANTPVAAAIDHVARLRTTAIDDRQIAGSIITEGDG